MAKKLTEGDPLKLIVDFSLPLLWGNLLQQTYNLMDTAIVGRFLGTDALAAVGSTSSVQFLVLGFCIGICSGFGIPVATHFGAGKLNRMKRSVFNAAFMAGFFALLVTVLCALLCHNILRLLNTAQDYYQNAYEYLFIIFLGIPFTIFYNFLSSMLRAVGDSRTPFIFLAVSTVLNIIMDILFIVVFQLGVGGAAAATVTAQGISAVSCLIYTIKRQPVLSLKRENMRLTISDLSNHLFMGIPMGLQFSITAIGSMYMQSANNALGMVYTAGFTAVARLKSMLFCPGDALSTGVSVFVSQNVGAGRIDRAKQGVIKGTLACCAYGLIAGIIIFFFGRYISMIFIDPSENAVLDAAAQYLRTLGMFFWVIGILMVPRLSTQGLGYSGRAIFSGVSEMIARILVVSLFVPSYGYTAICFCDPVAWIFGCFYIVPMCFHCLRLEERKNSSQE